jgi:hypothetical protein
VANRCFFAPVGDELKRLAFWPGLFVVAALYGTLLEWAVGSVWDMVGDCPYVYPGSHLTHSSFVMMPMWGMAGLQAAVIYLAIKRKKPAMLLWLLLLVALTFVLVLLLSRV